MPGHAYWLPPTGLNTDEQPDTVSSEIANVLKAKIFTLINKITPLMNIY
jgi:hypothetical protein